jgi:hypothetical protein
MMCFFISYTEFEDHIKIMENVRNYLRHILDETE